MCFQNLLSLDHCVGIIGGKPKHSVYFVGFQGEWPLVHTCIYMYIYMYMYVYTSTLTHALLYMINTQMTSCSTWTLTTARWPSMSKTLSLISVPTTATLHGNSLPPKWIRRVPSGFFARKGRILIACVGRQNL